MQLWQSTFLGRRTLPPELSELQIQAFFTYSPEILQKLKDAFDERHLIPAAIQLGFLTMAGTKLDEVSMLPRGLMKHLSDQLGVPAPSIASLQRLYKSEDTKRRQLAWAMTLLDWKKPTFDIDRQLAAYLDEIASTVISKDELLDKARRWCYDHRQLLRADSHYQRICGSKFGASETALLKEIDKAVPAAKRAEWLQKLMEPHAEGEGRATVLEWLNKPPSGRGPRARENVSKKVALLREMGVSRSMIDSLPVERIKHYARELGNRKPSRVERLTEPTRSLEVVSYLWFTLMRNSDLVVQMSRKALATLKSNARQTVSELNAASAVKMMHGIEDIKAILESSDLDLDQTRKQGLEIVSRFASVVNPNKSEAVRGLLTKEPAKVEALLKPLLALDLHGGKGSIAMDAIKLLKKLKPGDKTLPKGKDVPCNQPWDQLVNGSEDRTEAYNAFMASTLEALHQELRAGGVYVPHSEDHRGREELLIPAQAWAGQRLRYYGELKHPERVEEFLAPYLEQLPIKLKELADACEAGEFKIDKTRMSISPIEPEAAPAGYTEYKRALADEMGPIQLPELMLKLDAETRFSWKLLGRAPHDKGELISVYAALLVTGTNMSAKAVSMMTAGISAEEIIATMHRIESSKHLRAANAAVVEFMLSHKVVHHWGSDSWASSDMMSLETSRKLHNSRMEPRLKTPAIGTYTHTSGRWGILYDRPMLLGLRQAGHAIEGHLRQYSVALQHLAVDTHGYTNFAIALAKLLRLDLFPRIRDLDERKLVVPHGTAVPEILKPVTSFISLKHFINHYDDFMRVAGSVKDGTLTAILACQKYGSDALGDKVRAAGNQFGQVLRTLFLCDYYTIPSFRRELHRVLNRGEAVHVLQRAIYSGRMPHQKGRTEESLEAISGSLTLLANLLMAWTTQQIQLASKRLEEKGVPAPPDVLKHIGPARLWNVNLRGTLYWPVDAYADRILARTLPSKVVPFKPRRA